MTERSGILSGSILAFQGLGCGIALDRRFRVRVWVLEAQHHAMSMQQNTTGCRHRGRMGKDNRASTRERWSASHSACPFWHSRPADQIASIACRMCKSFPRRQTWFPSSPAWTVTSPPLSRERASDRRCVRGSGLRCHRRRLHNVFNVKRHLISRRTLRSFALRPC